MNNLKRVLSLGLVGTMLSGMMIMGAGAVNAKDFTDTDEILNQEAVATMVALNVINGKDDGSYYDPAGTVTRAEMAKMITIMMNGGKEPVLNVNSVPTFTDIDGHWAEKYIEYCNKNGVIAGRGDGTFDPEGTVTGSQAAKMALTALGYDAAVFHFTGIDWETNTNSYANAPDADLYDDLAGLNPSEPISRDNAAQLLYNTLDAYVMTREYDKVLSNGEVSYSYKLSSDSFMENKFGAVKVEGVVMANEAADLKSTSDDGSHLDANRTEITVTNHGDGRGQQSDFANGKLVLQATTGLDELGRSVNVYVKKNSNRTKADIMGAVIVSEDNYVVTDYSKDDITKELEDQDLDPADDMRIARNYKGLTAATSDAVSAKNVPGTEKIFIDNDDDGEVEIVLLNEYVFGRVTTYITTGDGAMTVNAGKTMSVNDSDKVVGFDDVKKDDYVIAAMIGGRLHVTKPETVTGELESYKLDTVTLSGKDTTGTSKLEVDGTNYNVSWLSSYTKGVDDISAGMEYGENSLETEAVFYIGKGNYVVAVGDVVDNAYNYCLVLGVGTSVDDQVKVALSDGTIGTYTLSATSHTYADAESYSKETFKVGSLCSYSIGSSGKITLKVLPTAKDGKTEDARNYALTDASFTKGKTALKDEGTVKAYTNSSTAFFYVDESKLTDKGNKIDNKAVDVYTGYDKAPSLGDATVTGTYLTNDSGRVVAVMFSGTDITQANVDDFIYVDSINNTYTDYTSVKGFINGDAERQTAVKVDGKWKVSKTIQIYTVNADGYYELENPDEDNVLQSDDATPIYKVVDSNSKTFVIQEIAKPENKIELKWNSDTMVVDHSKYLDDPTAQIGTAPSEGDLLIGVLFDTDEKVPDVAKLAVVLNPKKVVVDDEENKVDVGDAEASVSGGKITLLYKDTENAPKTEDEMVAAAKKLLEAQGYAVKVEQGAGTDDDPSTTYHFTMEKDGVTKKADLDTAAPVTKAVGIRVGSTSMLVPADMTINELAAAQNFTGTHVKETVGGKDSYIAFTIESRAADSEEEAATVKSNATYEGGYVEISAAKADGASVVTAVEITNGNAEVEEVAVLYTKEDTATVKITVTATGNTAPEAVSVKIGDGEAANVTCTFTEAKTKEAKTYTGSISVDVEEIAAADIVITVGDAAEE